MANTFDKKEYLRKDYLVGFREKQLTKKGSTLITDNWQTYNSTKLYLFYGGIDRNDQMLYQY